MTVTPVENRELSERLDRRYAEKYDMAEVFGDDLPAWRYYHVGLRGERGARSAGPIRAPKAVAAAGDLGSTRHATD